MPVERCPSYHLDPLRCGYELASRSLPEAQRLRTTSRLRSLTFWRKIAWHVTRKRRRRRLATVVTDSDWECYRKHSEDLVRLAAVLAGPSNAEDVVASAVLRSMSSRRWADVRDQRAYLIKAVVNEVRSSRRSAIRREARELRAMEPAIWDDGQEFPEVVDALSRLSVRQRAVVYLTYWADQTPSDIATVLGISEGAVRRHLARSRQSLRRLLR